jgi:hypothetical protein
LIAAAPPQVVANVPARISAVRQSGAAIGWIEGPCRNVQALVGGRVVTLGQASAECQPYPPFFALAGGTALWGYTYYGNTAYSDVQTASVRQRHHYVEHAFGDSAVAEGDYLSGVASAGGRLFYSIVNEASSNGCVGAGGPCVESVTAKSRVMELDGTRGRRVPGLPPALQLAGGGDRLAIVRAADTGLGQSGDVDVFAVPGFRRVATQTVSGKILDVAVSHDGLAVLTAGTIHRFDGKPDLAVAPRVKHISLSGGHVAYASGRTVRVDGRVVATRPFPPIGVHIAGGRLVWAERHRGGSTVYALRIR